MAIVPINLTGGSYEHKSRPLSKQKTRNFWPQLQASKKTKSPYVLESFYGLKLFKEQEGSLDRGMIVNRGVLYKVTDTTLYSVASDGEHTRLGSIPGSNRCRIKSLGGQLVINNGSGSIYIWDGENLTQNTDENLGTPNGVAVLNNQAIYDQGSGQGWDVSDVGLPGTINGLNNASAESDSDDLLIPHAFRETLYLMGTETIELWWNSGQGNPPFDKIQGAVVRQGLEAIDSVATNPDFTFFLGVDKQFHSLTPGSTAVDTIISNPAQAREMQKYAVTNDCIGWTMQLQGQWFYVATFPAQNITWVHPVGSGDWFEWGSSKTGRIRANSYAFVYGKHLVAEYNSGNIYELDAETYTDAGDAIIRTRDSAPLHSGLIGAANKDFEINYIEIVLEAGVGILEGQGSDPRLMFSVSRDGGKTFGPQRFLRIGKLGEIVTVRTTGLGRFQNDCVIRIGYSDPTYMNIYGAEADIEVLI